MACAGEVAEDGLDDLLRSSEFRARCHLGEHAGPIADDELDAFVGRLRGSATPDPAAG